MAESPYKVWLHLPTDTPNYYELLGVSVGESNLDTIRTAAANTRRMVCSARPTADQVADWSALLSQLEEAEATLSDSATRTAYNQSLGISVEAAIPMATPVNAPPPPPAPPQAPMGTVYQPTAYAPTNYTPAATPSTTSHSALPDPMAPVGRPAAPAVESPAPAPAAASVPQNAARIARKQKHRKRAERSLPIYLAVGAIGMATLAGIVIALQGKSNTPDTVAQAPQETGDAAQPPQPETQPTPDVVRRKQRAAASDVAVAAPNNPTESAKPARSTDAEAIGMAGSANTGEDNSPSMTTPDPDEPDEPEPKQDPQPEPETTTPEPTTPDPTEPTEPAMAATAAEVAALNERMTEIRGLLTMGEVRRAQQQLTATVTGSPEQLQQWSRLQTAAELIGQFHEGIQRSLADLGSLSEIDIGPAKVVVVELRPDDIIIRANGQNRTYALKQMPWALAFGLTNNILPDSQPENKVVKAMYLAVHHQRNAQLAEQAHELLQEAIAGGADAEMLVDFIDDRYGDATATPPPTPPTPPAPPATPATPAQAKAMQDLLDKVADDFGKHNLEAAAKRLAAAEPMPATPAQKTALTQLNKVATKLTSFHEAVEKAADGLKPDDEISISASVTAKILEVTQAKLRIALSEDVMHTIDRKQMPPALAVELAKRELGDSADGKVAAALFVRYHPSATKKYKEQARMWLEESGQDSDLLALFDSL